MDKNKGNNFKNLKNWLAPAAAALAAILAVFVLITAINLLPPLRIDFGFGGGEDNGAFGEPGETGGDGDSQGSGGSGSGENSDQNESPGGEGSDGPSGGESSEPPSEEEDASSTPPLDTITTITEIEGPLLKGHTITVRGEVVDEKGREVEGLMVLITLTAPAPPQAPKNLEAGEEGTESPESQQSYESSNSPEGSGSNQSPNSLEEGERQKSPESQEGTQSPDSPEGSESPTDPKNQEAHAIIEVQTILTAGKFEATFEIPGETPVGPNFVEAHTLGNYDYNESRDEREIEVSAETLLRLNMSRSFSSGNDIALRGTLTEKVSEETLPFKTVSFRLSDNSGRLMAAEEITTCEDGSFSLTATPNWEPGKEGPIPGLPLMEREPLEGSITYAGTELYLPSQDNQGTTAWHIYWQRVLIAALSLLIIGVIATAVIIKKRKAPPLIDAAPKKESGEVIKGASFKKYPWVINFPQIRPPFEKVWGVGDPLMVTASAASQTPATSSKDLPPGKNPERTAAVDSAETEISWAGEERQSLKTMASLSSNSYPMEEFTYSFTQKGMKDITIQNARGEILAREQIKLVDYREEIIEKAKSLFNDLGERDNSLKGNLTPREIIEKGLRDNLRDSSSIPSRTTKDSPQSTRAIQENLVIEPPRAKNRFITLVEYAVYSLKPIQRKEYEEFYLSFLQLKFYLEE